MRRLACSFSIALVLALGASLLSTGTAHAAEEVIRDARGDVVAYDSVTGREWVAPSSANGDILRTRIVHNQHAVLVRVNFRALNRRGDFRSDQLRILTNDSLRREVHLVAGPGFWRGTAWMARPNGREVRCDITHSIDYANNVVRIRIPRSCLGNPRWVRVGVGSFWSDGSLMFFDDAQLNGEIRDQLKLSGQIRRG
jgi:hypothetical protein